MEGSRGDRDGWLGHTTMMQPERKKWWTPPSCYLAVWPGTHSITCYHTDTKHSPYGLPGLVLKPLVSPLRRPNCSRSVTFLRTRARFAPRVSDAGALEQLAEAKQAGPRGRACEGQGQTESHHVLPGSLSEDALLSPGAGHGWLPLPRHFPGHP